MNIFSVLIARQKQFTGAVGILHIAPLNANKITGTKSTKGRVEEKDYARSVKDCERIKKRLSTQSSTFQIKSNIFLFSNI